MIKDHKDFDFIIVDKLTTSLLNWEKLRNNELELGKINLNGLNLVLKTYKGENQQNISIFTDKFKKKESKKDLLLTSSNINLSNANFYYYNENKQKKPIVYYKNINGTIEDFKIIGSKIQAHVLNTRFNDNYNIEVTNLSSQFSYTKSQMIFKNTVLKTKNSHIKTNMIFNYKKEDLSDFNNKVIIDAVIKNAHVSLKDLNRFYSELGKTDKIHFTTSFKGTLNDFILKNVNLTSDENSKIQGDLHFINAINRENGFELDANLSNLTSNHEHLKRLLPNILGKTLPSSFAMLGDFQLKGNSHITSNEVNAKLEIISDLGKSISDLILTDIDDIDNAKYKGKIELIDFDLGAVINDTLVGKFSMIADVDGIGFTKKSLNTSVIGHITKHQYKNYTYNNIDVNGVFKEQHFNGAMTVDDKNIKMSFKGLADLSKTTNSFKFKADVAYANFNKLNLFKRDEISILKGKIDIDLKGNTVDNIAGKINFTDASYTNQNDTYVFKKFDVNSSFSKNVRTLTVNSKEIVNGKIVGNFKFNELGLLAKNSLGSIYAHYLPEPVSSGQFLNFNFKIYDKIIGVFFPDVTLGKNTRIKGQINADDEKFKLTFKSPQLKIVDNIADKIKLQIDNKNPLYNTLFSVENISTKKYNLANLNLVNVTLNDTLFIRTNFNGGSKKKDNFNLSLYHTINKNNKSVIGIKKSDIVFNNQTWDINKINDGDHKIIFDNDFKNAKINKIKLLSGIQELAVHGVIQDAKNKNLVVNFKNIALEKITPKYDSIQLNGLVNGKIDYLQKQGKVLPIIDLNINDFIVNRIKQGKLSVRAKGDETLKKYNFSATLIDDKKEKFTAKGKVDLAPKESIIDATINMSNLSLKALSPLGGTSITKIRGDVSGQAKLSGILKNPDMTGNLYISNAGLAFPYLNTEYEIVGTQEVTLNNQNFNINNTTIKDIEKDTEAALTGYVSHNNFKKWYLNLNLISSNLLILNTEEKEETPYFGTGFIQGSGTIIGPTDNLVINLIAKTNPNTEFIVPLSDVNTIEDNELIHFIKNDSHTDEEVAIDTKPTSNKGLTLKVDLTVTPDALTKIVIDKATGSVLKGRGDADLNIEINTNGKFIMDGEFTVDSGVYELKYNIVNKIFQMEKGGKIYWSGNPYEADLDITAINKVKANPSVILENIQSARDVDVDLITKITGDLYNPDMEFDIKLPKASNTVKEELAYVINDDNKKMTQFFSLLSLGTFTNVDEFTISSGNSFLYGTLSEKITGLISSFLQDEDDLIKIGVNYKMGNNNNAIDNVNTNDQVDLTFKTNIYKKIVVNGIVGVPISNVGTNTQQSTIVGEIEIELPLNKKENLRAKAYNRKNEVQFDILDSEGYTQGLGISYEMTWDNAREFLEKIGIRKSKAKKEKIRLQKIKNQQKKDSIENSKKPGLIRLVK